MTIRKQANVFLGVKAVLSLSILVIFFTSLNQLTRIINTGLPEEITGLNQSLYIKYLSDQTLYYDEVLTQSARNYAFTSDIKWKSRYLDYEQRLQKTISQALKLGNANDSTNFLQLRRVNDQLVSSEYKSFGLTEKGEAGLAVQTLEDDNYWLLKEQYLESLKDYQQSKERETEALLANIEHLVNAHAENEARFKRQLKIGFSSYILILLLTTWSFSFVFFNRTIKHILMLKEGAERLKEGDFNTVIALKTQDEFQDLADTFNEMSQKLKVMTQEVNESVLRKELALQRSAFSRDLHDRLGIIISSLKMQIEGLGNFEKADKIQSVQEHCTQLLNEAYSQIREMADNTMPDSIVQKGLKYTLSDFLSRMEMIFSKEIKFITNLNEEDISLQQKASLYALIKELVNNSLKHSKCNKINVQMIKYSDHFIIMHEDDGIGFDPGKLPPYKGKGLANAQERIKHMNGTFYIDSSPGYGATITIEIPLKQGNG